METTVQAALGLASSRAALGSTASVIALTEGVLKMMFWGKLKSYAAIVLAGAMLSGTALVGYRAMGRVQAPAAAEEQPLRHSADAGGKPATPASSGSESPELDAIGNARLEVARKMRSAAEALYNNGEMSLMDYLTWKKRCDDVVGEVTVKTDADRIRFLERQVASLKQIEEAARKQFGAGQATQFTVLAAELARLDAEHALARVRSKVGTGPR